jgi:hypothetical protein
MPAGLRERGRETKKRKRDQEERRETKKIRCGFGTYM